MVRVYCDFDGTVCTRDIGEELFRSFAGESVDALVDGLLHGKINSQEWLRQMCDAIPSMSREIFETYVDQFAVDPHFAAFVQFAEERRVAVTVVSDGLDAYVGRVLWKAGLNRVPFFANHAEFMTVNGTPKLAVSFPHTDAECASCGNCKRNHMLTQSADEDLMVYVGDGFSDRCPVHYADVVFAKRHLIKHCQQQNITYHEFQNFGDVQKKLEEILLRKRIRHRREAAMARRDVFMQG
ncbi:MAG TPA: MtnX-like HAD-IB family phosphatase [Bacteroidota bacterium]|nr:MtnX-like HAD-IB family phosphatase [Bacteroidota bacterium]